MDESTVLADGSVLLPQEGPRRRKLAGVEQYIDATGWWARYSHGRGENVTYTFDKLVTWVAVSAEKGRRSLIVGLCLDDRGREVRRADDWSNFDGYVHERRA